MQIINLSFDNNQGSVEIDVEKAVLEIKITENNPSFPGGLQVNAPLSPIMQKLIDKAPNVFVSWGLKILLGFLDVA